MKTSDQIRQLIVELASEINDLAQVNEAWLEQQRGPVDSLRFRSWIPWTEWSELEEMLDDWSLVTADALRGWLFACKARLENALDEAQSLWTETERQSAEWLALDPEYEKRIALVDSILAKLWEDC